MQTLIVNAEQLVLPAGILGGTFVLGLLLSQILFAIAGMVAKRANSAVGQSLVKHGRGPVRIIIPLLMVQMLLPVAEMSAGSRELLAQALTIVLTVSAGWLIIKLTNVGEDLIFQQYRIDVSDNLQARKIHTQTRFLKRLVMVIVGVLTLAVVLMTFDQVRQVGASILASAGVAGIIVGFAAQKSIANLLAGFQIAFTGPINIDDVVIVEGEWGRIEEITLTYVVVRIWDLRRLVVPITYFIEKPFQNWTRVSADLLGTVFLYFDYTVPVQAVREELQRLLEDSPLWDKKVCSVQVTNSTEHTMEVRALMSAANSSDLWSLRCEVREKLVAFIQAHYPDSLPRMRAELLEPAKEIRISSKARTSADLDKPQN
jgi:small-conductance mechanosensitive channel